MFFSDTLTHWLCIFAMLFITSIVVSIQYPSSLTKNTFRAYGSFRQALLGILILLGSCHAFAGDSLWAMLGGVLYLLLGSVLASVVIQDKSSVDFPDFIKRHYGARSGFVVSVMGVLYVSLQMGACMVRLVKHLTFVLHPFYGFLLLIAIIVGLVLLFYLEGITFLQALLLVLFITVLPLLVRMNFYVAGGVVSWTRWVSGLYEYAPGSPLESVLYLLPTHMLAGHLFLINSDRGKGLKNTFLISALLGFACMALLFVGNVQIMDIKARYALPYCVAMIAWDVFLISYLFYTGSNFLLHSISYTLQRTYIVERISKLGGFITLLWGVWVVGIVYYLPSSLFCILSRYLLPFMIPFQLVFLVGIIGFSPNKKVLYQPFVVCTLTYCLGLLVGLGWLSSSLLCLLVSIVGFFIMHYRAHGGFSFVGRTWQEYNRLEAYMYDWLAIKESFKKILLFPWYMASLSRKEASYYGSQPFKFGIFFLLTSWVLPFFMTPFEAQEVYAILSLIHYVGFLLSIGLLMYPYWPTFLLPYFPLYWYITLGYCLPFSASLVYLLVKGSHTWLINIAITNMLLARLVGGNLFFLIHAVSISVSLAIGWYMPVSKRALELLVQDSHRLYSLLYTYIFSSLVGFFFVRKEKGENESSQKILQFFCQKVIHKVTNVVGLGKSYASLLELCQKSMQVLPEKEEGTVLIKIAKTAHEKMQESVELLKESHTLSQGALKNMTVSIRAHIKPGEFESYSVAACVQEALEAFALHYASFEHLALDLKNDFTFWGNNKYLIQVIFNLLENSYVHHSPDSHVAIWLKNNKLYYQDNGPGIESLHIPYIFDDFYTTISAVGMGLAYAQKVIRAFHGKILCESNTDATKPTYTRFIITLPNQIP